MKRILIVLASILFMAPSLFAQEKIDIFPTSGYDESGIYLNLILFWMALLGLVIILVLKLRETERIQKMNTSDQQKETALLE